MLCKQHQNKPWASGTLSLFVCSFWGFMYYKTKLYWYENENTSFENRKPPPKFLLSTLTLLITNILSPLCNLALQVTYFQTPNNWMQYNRIVKRGYSTLKHIEGTGQKKTEKKACLSYFWLVRLFNSLTFGISQESTEIKSLKYDITDVQ